MPQLATTATAAPGHGHDEAPPGLSVTPRRALALAAFVVAAVVFLYFGLPRLAGFGQTWQRLRHGEPAWLAVCVLFELVSFGGYVLLFRTVFVRSQGARLGWAESYQITLAGVAATRLFAAAGAGGVALTAWALRRSGMEPRVVAVRMVAFMVVLYTVYALALVAFGIGLYTGVLNGGGTFAITMVPAIFGFGAFVVVYGTLVVPPDLDSRLRRWSRGHGRLPALLARVSALPATGAAGVRAALGVLLSREPGTLGAVLWWGFDIATLWAAFHAFGPDPPPISVIVLAYFVGMLANVLPLPGGIGGVDGGMIGALAAFEVPFGYATVAVLAYRAFAFWLPTVPGAIAYLQLRRTVAHWRSDRPARAAPA